jgi:hypothetical protein|tara:strand:+ start:116 stop:346 length:231 start_codon:yes stop_codon:yes gene_type:complete
MDIRKISVGPDYKSGAMHYIVGQNVLGNSHTIHLIRFDAQLESIKIWIERNNSDEIVLWKEFNHTMPISIEYNINF